MTDSPQPAPAGRGAFLEALSERVLVCDGAMGTLLYARGVFLNRCFDELNLTQPGLVTSVHEAYVQAGADVLETNTFGANRIKLGTFGLGDQTHAINVAGANLARRAAGNNVFVAGAIGPLGVRIEPWGRMGVDEAETVFREQAAGLSQGGVDLFILETFRDVNELTAAVRAVRQVSQLPIVAQMTTEDDGNTLDGTPPEVFVPALEFVGADVIGVNCSVGPAAMLETIEAIARLTTKRLSAQPNAGRPRDVDGRNLYLCSPEYMASYARRFVATGVRLVGGCCGTTPDHIRQIALSVRASVPATSRTNVVTEAEPTAAVTPAPRAARSALGRILSAGQFALLGEAGAPRGLGLDSVLACVRRQQAAGVSAISVPDYPRNGARVSALALALVLERRSGVEAVLHVTCRDRNLMALQSDLLGAHAMGVRNVLLTTGDPAPQTAYADATSVFEVDAIGLLNIASSLNRGLDIGGQSLDAPTQFHIGAVVNPFSIDLEAEWRRLDFKVQAGADYLLTPPIFDLDAFDAALPRLKSAGLPIIAGLVALDSVRQAEFHASEVSGVELPDELLERLRQAADPAALGHEWSTAMARSLRDRVQGLRISTLHGSSEAGERLLSGLLP
ncbi:MAG TPA: bifunctional homocysteine S-methyltransferase/methylenetetrahydrofolate reductase [Vicinamibacterales bacterium]|nr:bifunctional homocysteine S-methyltransferase/methylenetetrahydrofolate reductase [Vicinamibacterales bacterium]